MLFISIEKKKARKKASIKKGAKGICVFIFVLLFSRIKIIPTTAPIQKAMIIEAKPFDNPSRKPNPSTNLASPKPIHSPFDITHKNAKGKASIGPANIAQ